MAGLRIFNTTELGTLDPTYVIGVDKSGILQARHITISTLFAGIDHGSISGLSDDDHSQYHNNSRALTWLGTRSTSDLAEGSRLYYTNLRAQDTVGGLLTDSSTIDFTYTSGVSITASVKQAGLSLASLGEKSFASLSNKPTSISGYGITDAYTKTESDNRYITSFTEADPVFTGHVSYGITSGKISNWDTAYGWGNHASAGYITTLDGDLTAIANIAGTSGLLKKTGVNTWTLDTNTYLTSFSELDPVYTASSWYTTTNNSSDWNSAYGWGNHASAGYLTTGSAASTYVALGGSYSNPTWITALAETKVLPSQTSNSGKFLTTNATTSSWESITKTTVGLGNVENVALSTWVGNSTISTVGTITSGSWAGTAIGISVGGTGATTASAAFDALSPLTTEGDIIYRNATVNTRLAKGTARQTLRMNSGATAPEWKSVPEALIIAVSDETTLLTTGTAKLTFRMPYAMTLTDVRANVNTAPTGSTIIVDINEGGNSILSTKLSIDATEKTSTTAATSYVLSDSSLADDAEITIDIDQVGSTIAGKGLKVTLIGYVT